MFNCGGGQKARVCLARAAYAEADIVLLDDPLSAVDAKVANVLFNECIGNCGIMQKSTVILVTHQLQFLPHCDKIIYLEQGKLTEITQVLNNTLLIK